MRRLLIMALVASACVTQPVPTCTDGVRDGEESDIDCGGPSCAPCELSRACFTNDDCQTQRCASKVCAKGTCADGRRDGDESDVDCGGSCGGCADALSCGAPTDCASRVCAGAQCAAPTCGDQQSNGAESDVDCGGGACAPCPMNSRCRRNIDCVAGSCRDGVCKPGGCSAPLLDCGPFCVDPVHDPAHCGGCGMGCAPGEVCANGLCALVCTFGTSPCGQRCVDTTLDVINCGACGNVCSQGERCLGGSCVVGCGQGQTNCGGECVRLATDTGHCGGCGLFCAPGELCIASQCTQVCQPPLLACQSQCVDQRFDPDHCGGCPNVCPAVQHAARLCLGGTCGRGPCDPGFADCNLLPQDGCEVTLATDAMNCGFCGRDCGAGGSCGGGMCQ